MFNVLVFKETYNVPNYIHIILCASQLSFLLIKTTTSEIRKVFFFFVCAIFTRKKDLIMFHAILFPCLFRTIFCNPNTSSLKVLFAYVVRFFSLLFLLISLKGFLSSSFFSSFNFSIVFFFFYLFSLSSTFSLFFRQVSLVVGRCSNFPTNNWIRSTQQADSSEDDANRTGKICTTMNYTRMGANIHFVENRNPKNDGNEDMIA